MSEEEMEKKIEIAGAVGAFAGFASGIAVMALVAIIFLERSCGWPCECGAFGSTLTNKQCWTTRSILRS